MKPHMFLFVGLLAGALALFGVSGCQRDTDTTQAAAEPTNTSAEQPISQADKDFLMEAEKSNIKEQTMARMAVQDARNDDVKEFAKLLEDDHTGILENIVGVMDKKGVAHPTDLADVRQEAENQMKTMPAATFDRDFINMMVEAHQKAVDTFRVQANSAQDESVREFAKDTLSTIEKHLNKAVEIQSKMTRT